MAAILQDKYILGHSETKEIVDVGEEISLNLVLLPQPAVNYGSVTGSVTDGTKPLSGSYVKILDSEYNPIAHTVTNDNGEFTFTTLTPGTLYYAYASANKMTLVRSGQFTVNTSSPTTLQPIVLTDDINASNCIIAGDLHDTDTGNPINGAVCYLYMKEPDKQAPTLLEITYTNSYGQFVFREIAPTETAAAYTIVFTALGYNEGKVITTISGTGQIVYIPKATLSQNGTTSNGTVSGMIKDDKGIVVGADVILYSVNTETKALTPIAFTKTDSNGVYLFFNVDSGSYLVKSNKMASANVTV